MREPMEVDLSSAVFDMKGQSVTKITLREPLGRDLKECGWPFVHVRNPRTGETHVTVQGTPMLALIARCGGVPASAVEKMAACDVGDCIEIMKFFCLYRAVKSDVPAAGEDEEAHMAELDT